MNETTFWATINTLATRYTDQRIKNIARTPKIRESIVVGLFETALVWIITELSMQDDDAAYNARMADWFIG